MKGKNPRDMRGAPPVVTTDTPIGPDVDLDREEVRLSDGTRLTVGVAERIVADTRARLGRPPLSASGTASEQIAFRVPPELRHEAERVARQQNKSMSQLAREALEAHLRAS